MNEDKKWIQKAIKHPGALHKALGVPQGEKIPAEKLNAVTQKGGKVGKEARLAKTLKSLHEFVQMDEAKKAVVSTKRPIGYKIADIGPGGKEHNVKRKGPGAEKLEERTLTPAETNKKEEIVKSMKKGVSGFRELYGKRAKEVMYATATKNAKELAEERYKVPVYGNGKIHEHIVTASGTQQAAENAMKQHHMMFPDHSISVHHAGIKTIHEGVELSEANWGARRQRWSEWKAKNPGYVQKKHEEKVEQKREESKKKVDSAVGPRKYDEQVEQLGEGKAPHEKEARLLGLKDYGNGQYGTEHYITHRAPKAGETWQGLSKYTTPRRPDQKNECTYDAVKIVVAEAFTRKHFRQVADVISKHPDAAKRKELASHHSEIFSKSNPRFDKKRFYAAANAELKEEVEQLDELKKDTLKSYIKKAVTSVRHDATDSGYHARAASDKYMNDKSDKALDLQKQSNKLHKKAYRRSEFIQHAVSKLEESEQLNEKYHVNGLYPILKEEKEIALGDRVHLGYAQKGGAGYIGTVHKIEGDTVHLTLDGPASVFGQRTVKGPKKHMSSLHEEAVKLEESYETYNSKLHPATKQSGKDTLYLHIPKSGPHKGKAVYVTIPEKKRLEESNGELPTYKVGDKVIAKTGPHKGAVHQVIHVHATGHVNIKPLHAVGRQNRYRLGAASAHPNDIEHYVPPVQEEVEQLQEHGYVGFDHKGNRHEVRAASMFAAIDHIRKVAKTPKSQEHKVHVKLAELDTPEGPKQYVHSTASLEEETSQERETKRIESNDRKWASRKARWSAWKKNNPEWEKRKQEEKRSRQVKEEIVLEAVKKVVEKKKAAEKSKQIEVKGPGIDEKFQKNPVITPLTTTVTRA